MSTPIRTSGLIVAPSPVENAPSTHVAAMGPALTEEVGMNVSLVRVGSLVANNST